jgi:hypothetical protein
MGVRRGVSPHGRAKPGAGCIDEHRKEVKAIFRSGADILIEQGFQKGDIQGKQLFLPLIGRR